MIDIPNLPGVPSLPSFAAGGLALLRSDAATIIGNSLRPVWGLYLRGAPVMVSSLAAAAGVSVFTNTLNSIVSAFGGGNLINDFSVVDFIHKRDWSISDYPVEGGGFQSYNKVQTPFDVRLKIAAGGTPSNRQALIDQAEAIGGNLELYDVVTPERTYRSCNIQHFDYKRAAANGVGLVVIDFWLLEIRQGGTTAFSATANPTDASPQGLGNVQPQSFTDAGLAPTVL